MRLALSRGIKLGSDQRQNLWRQAVQRRRRLSWRFRLHHVRRHLVRRDPFRISRSTWLRSFADRSCKSIYNLVIWQRVRRWVTFWMLMCVKSVILSSGSWPTYHPFFHLWPRSTLHPSMIDPSRGFATYFVLGVRSFTSPLSTRDCFSP